MPYCKRFPILPPPFLCIPCVISFVPRPSEEGKGTSFSPPPKRLGTRLIYYSPFILSCNLPSSLLPPSQVRSELTYKEQQEEEMQLLEKRREREKSKAEAIQEDITFKTTMGMWICTSTCLYMVDWLGQGLIQGGVQGGKCLPKDFSCPPPLSFYNY